MILLDTDVCIELLHGNRKVLAHRKSIEDDIAVSFMTVGELFYGAAKSSREKENRLLIEKLLLSVVVIDGTQNIMERFGEIKGKLEKMGKRKEDADLMVAACALEECSKLISGNKRHYADIDGVVLEDWTKE